MSKIHDTLKRVQEAKQGLSPRVDDGSAGSDQRLRPREWLVITACLTAGAALASVWLGWSQSNRQQRAFYRTMGRRLKQHEASMEAAQRTTLSQIARLEKRISELEDMRNDLSALRQRDATIEERLKMLRLEKARLEEEIEALRLQAVQLSHSQDRLQDQLGALEAAAAVSPTPVDGETAGGGLLNEFFVNDGD